MEAAWKMNPTGASMRKVQLNSRVDEDLKRKAKADAALRGINLEDYMNELLKDRFKPRSRPPRAEGRASSPGDLIPTAEDGIWADGLAHTGHKPAVVAPATRVLRPDHPGRKVRANARASGGRSK